MEMEEREMIEIMMKNEEKDKKDDDNLKERAKKRRGYWREWRQKETEADNEKEKV